MRAKRKMKINEKNFIKNICLILFTEAIDLNIKLRENLKFWRKKREIFTIEAYYIPIVE